MVSRRSLSIFLFFVAFIFSLSSSLFVLCVHLGNGSDAHIEKISVYDEGNEIHIEFDKALSKIKNISIDLPVFVSIEKGHLNLERRAYKNTTKIVASFYDPLLGSFIKTIRLII